ncbi:MAG: single-stranded-DNA-specific exonuclease RecJ [Chloroflexi bacterium]|nr:single-stranded-DNA-specific exonuclease RecJ [Chloroflexota bacterium]
MAPLAPRFRWLLPGTADLTPELRSAGAARGLSQRVLEVLAARGHRDGAALAALFDPPETCLHDPWMLPDAATFLARVRLARTRADRVLVSGDFDADGLTGLAIMVRSLRMLGIDAEPYVPDRLTEGHGLSLAAVERAAREERRLIITVDCGISSVAEVAAAVDSGIDVLITDHHRIPSTLPAAVAIVDPHLPGSRYPHPDLAGSGVAFKLAQLILSDLPDGATAALDLADLAAIGTLADLVPVTGENRAIIRLGLERIRRDPRPGIAALLRHAGLAPERVDPDTIAFALAPRLNAVGRVGDATAAAQLLISDDADEAERSAAELQAANLVRRQLTAAALVEARDQLAGVPDERVIVIVGDWPVGVIGLIAGRLAEESGRPTVVFSRITDPWRGSARSAGGFDLAAAFAACGDLFERHGGHPAAAGCSLPSARFAEFRDRLLLLAAGVTVPDPRPPLRLDLVTGADAVDYVLFRELAALDRSGDLPPLVGISGLRVGRVRRVSGGHVQITLRKGMEVLDGICFGRADDMASSLAEGASIDVVARLASRAFGGFESLQLEVRDVAPAGALRLMEHAA